MDSILLSVNKMLGIEEDYDHFNPAIVMHINAALSDLTQLGVGPSEGYSISDANAQWSELVSDDSLLAGWVKEFVFARVKLIFDPPATSFVQDALQKRIDELTSRINIHVDPKSGE